MNIRSLVLITALIFLAACTSGGYNRAYIISDTVDGEIVEPAEIEKR